MKSKWARGICAVLAAAAVTAGISYQVLCEDNSSEKLNAVLVMAQLD